jgi:hypothetical protein
VSRAERVEILQNLEDELGMPALAYVTGDRPNMTAQIAWDQLPLFPRHLAAIGEQRSVALLLYTRGGETNMAWPVVNFLRAYAKKLVVLIPFHAHSSGTLIALGADQIYMSKLATLSPIDPSVANMFNPQDPLNPQNRFPIAVEDVMAYFELAKDNGVVRDEDLAATFRRLAESVHPLALGNVHRSIAMVEQLAEKLIRLHARPATDPEEIKNLIKRLTTQFYTHSHLINRKEAGDLGLPVKSPKAAVENLLLDYYGRLVDDLKLVEAFDPNKLVAQAQAGNAAQPATNRFEQAYIETKGTADTFVIEGRISLQPQVQNLQPGVPPQLQPQMPPIATFEITRQEWERV